MGTQSSCRWVELPGGIVVSVSRDQEWLRLVKEAPAVSYRIELAAYRDATSDSRDGAIRAAETEGKTSCQWLDPDGKVYTLTWTKLRIADLPDRTPEYLRPEVMP